MYGQVQDSVADASYAAGRHVMSFEDSLRQSIREQPYMALAVAVGVGICLGRLSAQYGSNHEAQRVYRY